MTVTDSTGAVLPGATVAVASVERGVTRTTTADRTGVYRVPVLGPGQYDLRIGPLDCQGALASFIGDRLFGLPFREADITIERQGHAIRVESRRIVRGGPAADFVASYTPRGVASTPAIARPLFKWNHATIMDWGGECLSRKLGAELVGMEEH